MYSYTRFDTINGISFRISTVYHYCNAKGEHQYSVPREEVESAEPGLKAIEQQHFAEVDRKLQANGAGYLDRIVYTHVLTLLGNYCIVTAFYKEDKR